MLEFMAKWYLGWQLAKIIVGIILFVAVGGLALWLAWDDMKFKSRR
jgi:hypothetical protein